MDKQGLFLEKVIALSNDHYLQQDAIRAYSEKLGMPITPILVNDLLYYIPKEQHIQFTLEIEADNVDESFWPSSDLVDKLRQALNSTTIPTSALETALLFSPNWENPEIFRSLFLDYVPRPVIVGDTTRWIPSHVYGLIASVVRQKTPDVKYAGYLLALALGLVDDMHKGDCAGPVDLDAWHTGYCSLDLAAAVLDERNWITYPDDFISFYRITADTFEAYLSEAQYFALVGLFQIRRYDDMVEMLRVFLASIPPVKCNYLKDSLHTICTLSHNWEDKTAAPRKPALPQEKMTMALGVKYKLSFEDLSAPFFVDASLYLRVRALLPRIGGRMVAAWVLVSDTGMSRESACRYVSRRENWAENPPTISAVVQPFIEPEAGDI